MLCVIKFFFVCGKVMVFLILFGCGGGGWGGVGGRVGGVLVGSFYVFVVDIFVLVIEVSLCVSMKKGVLLGRVVLESVVVVFVVSFDVEYDVMVVI